MNKFIQYLIKKMHEFRMDIIILIVYTILSIIFTYPVAFSENRIPGNGDVFWFLWNFWWVKTALFNFSNPYYTNYIYYPTSTTFIGILPFDSIISVPFQYVLGITKAYIFLWLATFILSGYTTFLLIKHFTNNAKAAFICGLIFMFCPFRLAHALGHVGMISTQWIPLVVLFLDKTIKELKRSNAAYLALFFFLASASFVYYIIFLPVFISMYILFQHLSFNNIINKKTVKRLGSAFVAYGLLMLLYYYPLIYSIFIMRSDYFYSEGFITYSADLLGFFLPFPFHPVFKSFLFPIYGNFTGNIAENTVFIGYTVLFFSLVALMKVRTNQVKFWISSSAIFFILSLGPVLHFNGVIKVHLGEYTSYIQLPYAILMHIPIFSLARAPARWDIMLMLSLTVLTGYGLKYTFDILRDSTFIGIKKKDVLSIFISLLILFEFLSIPYPMSITNVPLFYEQISKDGENYSILELPANIVLQTPNEVMYYQTIHGKKLVNGDLPRIPDDKVKFFESISPINKLVHLQSNKSNQTPEKINFASLSSYNINLRYIILHKKFFSTVDQFNYVNNSLKVSLGESPIVYKNDSLIVYKFHV